MKSKKALILALLIVASLFLLPSFIPISPVFASGSGLPLNPSFMHLEYYTPPEYNVTYHLDDPQKGDLWMTIHPMEETGDKYNLTYWVDTDLSGNINTSDQIILRNLATGKSKWYHVEHVTATIKVENTTVTGYPNVFFPYPLYLEFNGTNADFAAIGDPRSTKWHMIYPQWSMWFHLTSWDGAVKLNFSDLVDFETIPDTVIPGFSTINWHVDSVKTDLIVSEVEGYPEDPEFIHLDLYPPGLGVVAPSVGHDWHEIYPDFCNNYSLTYWIDTDGSGEIDYCDQIALLDKDAEEPAKWYHVEWVTATIKVESDGTEWYLEFGGNLSKFAEIVADPVNTFWHRVKPGFSSWFTMNSCVVAPLTVGDTITFIETGNATWDVLELKTNLIVSEEPFYPDSPGLMHLDIIPLYGEEWLEQPTVCSNWSEIYPTVGPPKGTPPYDPIILNTYHIFSHIDNNNNSIIDHSDLIKLENRSTHEKKWYHVECVTTTIHISQPPDFPVETLILEFGTNTTLDKFFNIRMNPVDTWWHEVWSLFSNWYKLATWIDNGDLRLSPSDTVTFTGPMGIELYTWHVDMVKTNLIVSPVKPPTYFWVSPRTNIVQPICNSFTVDVMVEDAQEALAWEATIAFNSTVLGVESVVEGDWLNQTLYDTEFKYTDRSEANNTGVLSIGCSLKHPFDQGAAVDGKLCSITFHVDADGRSPLNLVNTSLVDMALVSTDYPNKDGFFCSTGATTCLHDVAIVDVEVLDHQVQQGDVVLINVTIHNEGNHEQDVNVTVYADLECHVWNATDPDELLRGDEIWSHRYSVVNLGIDGYNETQIEWDTTLYPGEQYTIWAEVVKIDGEEDDDPGDNVFVDGNVHIQSNHDLKVVDVTLHTPQVDAIADHKGNDTITQAEEAEQRTARIDVTVLNEGKNTENFTVTITADPNVTKAADEITLGPKTVLNLPSCKSTVVGFEWDMNNDPNLNGTYTINATVTLTTPAAVEEEKNLADNAMYADDNLTVVIRDMAILSISVMTDHPDGWNPITRMNITVKNVGTVFMRFNIIVFADPMNLTQVVPPYIKPSFPIIDGDEVFCGAVSTNLMPGQNLSYTGMALPDGTPGLNRSGTPLLSTILAGKSEPRYAAGTPIKFPYGPYLIVAIIEEDPRYPDKNYANDYATTSYTINPVYDDVGITYVQRQRRFVYPGDPFYVNVTVCNQGLNTNNVNITVWADEDTTPWNGNETLVGVNVTGSLASGACTTRIVTCTSVGLITGTWYSIFANATLLSPPDEDPNDNTRYDLTIQPNTYDIAIINMTSDKPQSYLDCAYPTWRTVAPVVGVNFYVTVFNNDTVNHIFDCVLYWGTTEVWRQTLDLSAQEYRHLTIYMSIPSIPKAFPYPSYPITAKALVVDSRPENNELSNRTLTVRWPGDASGPTTYQADGKVRYEDLSALASHWYGHAGFGLGYKQHVDWNMDGMVRYEDLSILASYWYTGPLQ